MAWCARSRAREASALSAAALVPLTPLFWPLVWNDFRELQLVAPFVLWAVQGVRSRSVRLAALGIAGMLACRQEFAVMVATFAFLPPRRPESLSTTLRWRRAMVLDRALLVPLRLLRLPEIHGRPRRAGCVHRPVPRAPRHRSRETLADVARGPDPGNGRLGHADVPGAPRGDPGLALDLGPVQRPLGHAVPRDRRVAPRAIRHADGRPGPGRGLIGYARLATWLLPAAPAGPGWPWPGSPSAAICGVGLRDVTHRLASVPAAIDRQEAEEIWAWIRQVGPDDAVIADYEVSAPLSSRRWLYSYILDVNLPPGFPTSAPNSAGSSSGTTIRLLKVLLDQGFDVVHRGPYLTIARRGTISLAGISDFFRFRANTNPR